ncbi:MAG: hypothetical protein COA43_09145 [Robiginitomaculum sp.]|nr:MAG: hypothetical protein COA43_09145 [Robiginitomaculum sp.]
MTTGPTSCWVISDGRRGIENQACGIAEALARLQPLNIHRHTIVPKANIPKTGKSGAFFKALPPLLQFAFKSQPCDYGLTDALPRIAIGCGRQAIAPLLALKAKAGEHIYTIYVQAPRINANRFDLVIVPHHDKISGANIERMIGSPNRLTTTRLKNDMAFFFQNISALPTPRIAVFIGGNSKTHRLSNTIHKKHLSAIHTLLGQKMSLMITTSRRTPEWVKADYQKLAKAEHNIWYADGSGDNPYFAFLASANALLVTEDSTNMLTEACFTGKPVFSLPMQGRHGKFKNLYSELAQRCNLTPFTGLIDGEGYPPLDETSRIAKAISQRLDS